MGRDRYTHTWYIISFVTADSTVLNPSTSLPLLVVHVHAPPLSRTTTQRKNRTPKYRIHPLPFARFVGYGHGRPNAQTAHNVHTAHTAQLHTLHILHTLHNCTHCTHCTHCTQCTHCKRRTPNTELTNHSDLIRSRLLQNIIQVIRFGIQGMSCGPRVDPVLL